MLTDQEIETYDRYRETPADYFTEVLGVDHIEPFQADITQQIAEFDRVVIKATHSVGKTWTMARIALWFFNLFPNAIVITTAPTHRQVKLLLWGEIRKAHKASLMPIGGRLLDTELKYSDKHYMIGFSPEKKAGSKSTEQQASTFQGFHSDNVLVIMDEATGVPPDVWTQADGLLTSGSTVKFVAIANPTTKNCQFFKCFQDPSFKKIKISCFDSPNLKANGIHTMDDLDHEIETLRTLPDDYRAQRIQNYEKPVPHLLTAQFVLPYVMKLGKDHPLVLSKVFGEFPADEDNVLVQYEDVARAIARDTSLDLSETAFVGIDVARYGVDKTVITGLQGYKQLFTEEAVKRSITHVTGRSIDLIKEITAPKIIVSVDATGLGAGVLDNLIEAKAEGFIDRNVEILECHFGASAANPEEKNQEIKDQDKARYANLKAKMYDLLGADLKEHLDLLEVETYLEELPSVQYKFDSKGRVVIESKKEYKERTGRGSPDHGDSLALANYGRHANVGHGIFQRKDPHKPIVKTAEKNRKRKTGIKIREY